MRLLSRERSGRRPLLTCFTWVRLTLNLSQTSVWLMWTPFLASQQCVRLLPWFVMTEVADNRWSAYSCLMWEQRLCQNISLQQSERRIDYSVLGDRFPDNDVKTGAGGGFTDSRSRLLIAVNLWARRVLFSWNSGLFRPFSSYKLNSGESALTATPTSGLFVITFLPLCETPGCVRMKPNQVMPTDRHSPQLSFSHDPPPDSPPLTAYAHRWAVIVSLPQTFNFLTSLNCNIRNDPPNSCWLLQTDVKLEGVPPPPLPETSLC